MKSAKGKETFGKPPKVSSGGAVELFARKKTSRLLRNAYRVLILQLFSEVHAM